MKRIWMTGAAALMAVSVAGLDAQSTGTQTPQTQTPQTQTSPAATDMQATTTMRGCVYKEQDVPGRTPNVAERAGVLEDYILVASMDHSQHAGMTHGTTSGTTGTTPPTTTPPPTTPPTTNPPATSGTTGTAASGMAMGPAKAYKLEKIADEQLRAMVGKMVEVTGKVDAERSDTAPTGTTGSATGTAGAPARDKSLGPDAIELPEFEVTSIREVEGTCPATPTIKK